MTRSKESNYVPALRFRWLTQFYDAVVSVTTRERIIKQALIQQTHIREGQQILDLACGTGTLAIRIKQIEPRVTVTGVDGDPAILDLAVSKTRRAEISIRFDNALSWQLPYPSAHFDRIVSSLFFHHLSWDEKRRTAAELLRVLKPGGELHVADWGPANNLLVRGMFGLVQLLDGFANTQDNVTGKLPLLFEKSGFSTILQNQSFNTLLGTIVLYSATRPR